MEKLYYSISEVAEMLGLAQSTLRFWEKEFPQLRPRLTSGGTRKYTTEDINLVRTIKYLLKDLGLTIPGARERLSAKRGEEETKAAVIARLQSIRDELVAIRREINATEAMAEDTIVDGDEWVEQD